MAGVRRLSDARGGIPDRAPARARCVRRVLQPDPRGYGRCFACASGEHRLAAFAPISYSVAGGPLHLGACRVQARRPDPFVPDGDCDDPAAILWRFLERHEGCVAAMAGIERFDFVTTYSAWQANRSLKISWRNSEAMRADPKRCRTPDPREPVVRGRRTERQTPRWMVRPLMSSVRRSSQAAPRTKGDAPELGLGLSPMAVATAANNSAKCLI